MINYYNFIRIYITIKFSPIKIVGIVSKVMNHNNFDSFFKFIRNISRHLLSYILSIP